MHCQCGRVTNCLSLSRAERFSRSQGLQLKQENTRQTRIGWSSDNKIKVTLEGVQSKSCGRGNSFIIEDILWRKLRVVIMYVIEWPQPNLMGRLAQIQHTHHLCPVMRPSGFSTLKLIDPGKENSLQHLAEILQFQNNNIIITTGNVITEKSLIPSFFVFRGMYNQITQLKQFFSLSG